MIAAYLLMLCRIALAATFAWSAGAKLRDITSFRDAITNFRLLPVRWSTALAWSFVSGEVAVVLLLGAPALLGLGFLLAAALLALFSAALVVVLRRDQMLSCNCFGSAEQPISGYDIVRNVVLIGGALVGGWALTAARTPLSPAETALLGMIALGCVVLVTHLGVIVETLRQPFEVQ